MSKCGCVTIHTLQLTVLGDFSTARSFTSFVSTRKFPAEEMNNATCHMSNTEVPVSFWIKMRKKNNVKALSKCKHLICIGETGCSYFPLQFLSRAG